MHKDRRSLLRRSHTGGGRGACAASGFLRAHLLHTWQKECPALERGGGASGGDAQAPSEPEVGPGILDVRNEVEPGSGAG